MMTIYEPPVRNSGIIGGKFLERTRVAKPNSAPDQPTFYGPQDFYIGAVVDIFKHRFVIVSADEYVLKYMEDHKSQFPGKFLLWKFSTYAARHQFNFLTQVKYSLFFISISLCPVIGPIFILQFASIWAQCSVFKFIIYMWLDHYIWFFKNNFRDHYSDSSRSPESI